uniref:Phosphoinositide-3-kinase adaptor protein 1 n=1 Tax=Myripristis murdjan TaxID=586833 RepID=A0A667YE98_9TELE
QRILKSSHKFPKRSILLYAVGLADQLHGYNFEYFHSSKCIVLLLTGAFLDILGDPELRDALQRLLHPPHRVVVLLCGLSEDDVQPGIFEHWTSWRKVYADDEPAVYIATILESIAETDADSQILPATSADDPVSEETESVGETETALQHNENESTESSTGEEMRSATHLACLTVQPNRVLCGTIFIIFTQKLDSQSALEVEFSCKNVDAKQVPATLENEYTVSVAAPDMPAGVVSLTMHIDQFCVGLKPVKYYTNMGEVNWYLENATDPMEFVCQAFNITSNKTESLDDMLTDSIKSKTPASGLQLFGIKQIEEDNMAAYQRDEELPTLLHFAAKYGLKKLTTVLLQCPGALQAYSVMNKYGDYPNTLAERSGFSDLRQFMDDFVETADMLKSHIQDSISPEEGGEVYEMMSATSQDIMMKYSTCTEDIYESMLAMLCPVAKPEPGPDHGNKEHLKIEEGEEYGQDDPEKHLDEEEEDPYNLLPEDIYDTVDKSLTYAPEIFNRPPAPIPRPQVSEPTEPKTYISRAFSKLSVPHLATSPVYDPYGGMKTPGQRQLIALQERVKVGAISVDEAVQEFKAWQFDHERRANSLRYQQENLRKLRESITRRHKIREKSGKEIGRMTLECAVYEPAPRVVAPQNNVFTEQLYHEGGTVAPV